MNLDINARHTLVQRLLDALRRASPASVVELKGSLAEGRSDQYSDIDILWETLDADFITNVNHIEETLSEVQPIESLRSDPNFLNSEKRRIIYVQFKDTPLFWRVDIAVFAQSIRRDPDYDLHNEAARGDDWSPSHSALMNAIAAIKALLRNRPCVASGLLERAFKRVNLAVPVSTPRESIPLLLNSIIGIDPKQRSLADRIEKLYHEALD